MKDSKEYIINTLRAAGKIIREIESGKDLGVRIKKDSTPVTRADRLSDSHIRQQLNNLSAVPVLSEEQDPKSEGKGRPGKFWLLDPLDGTKEFIKGNGEYCISLALIEDKRPIEGYIYWPVGQVLWYAIEGEGAYRIENNTESSLQAEKNKKTTPLVLLRSRSHHKEEEVLWCEKAAAVRPLEISEQGSALKFCHIAEGKADFYIKKGRIFGWDIAAGDIILAESGGRLIAYGEKKELEYPYASTEMPYFLACSSRIDRPEDWLF